MKESDSITIVDFNKSLSADFRELNLGWIKKYFEVEPADEKVLNDPEGEILNKGGFIFFVKIGDEVAGTVSLIKVTDTEYELSKMAVYDKWSGRKAGNALIHHCIQKGRELNAEKLILYSNTGLLQAIHLYKKFGFKEVPLEGADYRRANIKMELTLNTHDDKN